MKKLVTLNVEEKIALADSFLLSFKRKRTVNLDDEKDTQRINPFIHQACGEAFRSSINLNVMWGVGERG